MTVKSIAYALAATLLATSAHAEDWEGNFRRCDVTKSFSQGKVRISVGEMIELDILWNDGADLDEVTAADISVRIDNTPLPHPKPLKYGAGRKAVAFLKKCDKFWTCVVERGKPHKPKHCFVPRDMRQQGYHD